MTNKEITFNNIERPDPSFDLERGQASQRIDPRRSVLPLHKVGKFTISQTGDLDITDVGFSPNSVQIIAEDGLIKSD